MTRALVLMKAMPPTKGHERLIDFAANFADSGWVVLDMAEDEPLSEERTAWAKAYAGAHHGWYADRIVVDDQNPQSNGFWERWAERWSHYGKFDYVIGSEGYCAKVAETIGARYIPYDPKRELAFTKATSVREHPLVVFASVASAFQEHMRTKVTIWGAESTGKTTLSKALGHRWSADVEWTHEWARPYLETVGPEITVQSMTDIWHGQYAIEENAMKHSRNKPWIVQDTDLYSTIGYWEQAHWASELGPVPAELVRDAYHHRSDLYIITTSNIPFEEDPIRYGGDHRESPDEYWVALADKYNLNYVVLTETEPEARLEHATELMRDAFFSKNRQLMGAVRV